MVDLILKAKATLGLPNLGDGIETQAFLDKYGGLLTQDLLPRYSALGWRGLCFAASTPATGVAPGTAIGTTAAHTLYNPKGSGKLLIPVMCSMGYISGTLGAGTVWLLANIDATAAAVSGTLNQALRTRYGQSGSLASQGNTGLSYTTATLPLTPSIVRPLFSIGGTPLQPFSADGGVLEGIHMIEPGCALSMHATAAAGAAPLVAFGMVWIEIDE